MLKDRLRSPSGYARISADERTAELNAEEYLAASLAFFKKAPDDIDRRLAEDGGKHYRAIIEYDAPNAYGTLIRGSAVCEYVWNYDLSDRDFLRVAVQVDGYTGTEWLVEQIKSSR